MSPGKSTPPASGQRRFTHAADNLHVSLRMSEPRTMVCGRGIRNDSQHYTDAMCFGNPEFLEPGDEWCPRCGAALVSLRGEELAAAVAPPDWRPAHSIPEDGSAL